MTVRTPGLAWPQHKGTLGVRYEEARQRIVEVIREATSSDDAAAARPVPACPGWRVRDVLAHLCGNCTDIAAGNIDGAGTDEWTAAQVDARRDQAGDFVSVALNKETKGISLGCIRAPDAIEIAVEIV